MIAVCFWGDLIIYRCFADIMEMGGGSASTKKMDPYVLAISIFAFSCLAVAGTAVALYAEVRSSAVYASQKVPGSIACQTYQTLPVTSMEFMHVE